MTTQVPSPDARIVVGVDGSKQSKLALSWAVPISAATGALDRRRDGLALPGQLQLGLRDRRLGPHSRCDEMPYGQHRRSIRSRTTDRAKAAGSRGPPCQGPPGREQRSNHAHRRQPRPRRILRSASRVGQRQLCRTRDVSSARHTRRPTSPVGLSQGWPATQTGPAGNGISRSQGSSRTELTTSQNDDPEAATATGDKRLPLATGPFRRRKRIPYDNRQSAPVADLEAANSSTEVTVPTDA